MSHNGIIAALLVIGLMMWIFIRKPRIPQSMIWTIAGLLFVTLLFVFTHRT